MRRFLLLFATLLSPAAPAFAQVTVDLHALDALPKRPAVRQPVSRPAFNPVSPRAVSQPRVEAVIPPPAPATPPTPAAVPAPPAAALPVAPPPVAALAPITPPAPPADATPPPPPPITPQATTAAAAMPSGLRLTFAAGQSDLSQGSANAINRLVQSAGSGESVTFNVLAYAAGVPNDPSAPRRLSLARAIAVRSALIAGGVPSAHIYLRALGAQSENGPADRVDVSVMGANAPAQTKSQ